MLKLGIYTRDLEGSDLPPPQSFFFFFFLISFKLEPGTDQITMFFSIDILARRIYPEQECVGPFKLPWGLDVWVLKFWDSDETENQEQHKFHASVPLRKPAARVRCLGFGVRESEDWKEEHQSIFFYHPQRCLQNGHAEITHSVFSMHDRCVTFLQHAVSTRSSPSSKSSMHM